VELFLKTLIFLVISIFVPGILCIAALDGKSELLQFLKELGKKALAPHAFKYDDQR
jgi:hypothetical protein